MSAEGPFLVSNFRELISCLEGLRVSKYPGRGLSRLSHRPLISGSLRASEADLLTAGVSGEFPVLISVPAVQAKPGTSVQERSIPLDHVQAIVFGDQENCDRLVNRTLENASPDGLVLKVEPLLFGGSGPARFGPASSVHEKTPETGASEEWTEVDSTCGAIAALLALADRRPEAREFVAQFLHGRSRELNVADVVGAASAASVWGALLPVIRGSYGEHGHDPMALLGRIADALRRGGFAKEEVDKFRAHVTGILNSERIRKKDSLSDEKNIVLRALSIVIQRETVLDIIDDRVSGELPGPRVHVTALALAGLREGLAHLPVSLKNARKAELGRISASLENGAVLATTIADTLLSEFGGSVVSQPEPIAPVVLAEFGAAGIAHKPAESDTWLSVQGDLPLTLAGGAALHVGVTGWKVALIKRALRDMADKPEGWRLYLDQDDHLWLEVPLSGDLRSAANVDLARLAIQTALEWVKPKRRRASTKRKLPMPELPLMDRASDD